jgi:hypothetical protein
MDLHDPLLLTIVDKLLIGILLLIVGLWLNERFEKLKGEFALATAFAQLRAGAIGALWKLTQPLTPRGGDVPTAKPCKAAFNDVRKCYYSDLGAMHLTFSATDTLLQLLNALEKRQRV